MDDFVRAFGRAQPLLSACMNPVGDQSVTTLRLQGVLSPYRALKGLELQGLGFRYGPEFRDLLRCDSSVFKSRILTSATEPKPLSISSRGQHDQSKNMNV